MQYSISRQIWALMRRQAIVLRNRPISSVIRHLLWPGVIIGLIAYLVTNVTQDLSQGFSNSFLFAPQILFATTAFIAYYHASNMIADRSTGVKSLMITMGLRRLSYYLANIICMLITMLPIIMTLGVISIEFVIFDSMASKVSILLLFILFNLQYISFIFALSSFITSTTYSSVILLILLLEGAPTLLIDMGMDKSVNWRWLLIFCQQFTPFGTMRMFAQSYLKNKNDGTIDYLDHLTSAPTYLIMIYSIIWTILAFAFTRWFEEVCPWQNDSAIRKPCFCFETNNNEHQDRAVDTGDPIFLEAAERYFEQRNNENHKIGIRLSKLSKSFRSMPAVSNVSFNIFKGETTLLLGHNGAGKSTLMNMILGLLQPSSGKVFIKDFETIGRSGVGVCPQSSILDGELTVRQHLEFFVDIKSTLDASERRSHILQTLKDINLSNHADKKPAELSGGMKRKLSLGLAFIGKSQILILDEPSSGLDPDSRVFIWNAIRRYRAERTVLLSTQHMEEADYLGDRIAIMSSGQIVCCGSSLFLNKLFGSGYKLRIECFKSKRREIFEYVHKHFESTKSSVSFDGESPSPPSVTKPRSTSPQHETISRPGSSLSGNDKVVDFILELKTGRDAELALISLLEHLETNGEKMGIRSYGLKSSSIEDVMLHTSKYFSESLTKTAGAARVSVQTTESNIATLLSSSSSKNALGSSQLFVHAYALLAKSILYYYNDWMSVVIYRLLLPITVMYFFVRGFGSRTLYQPEPVLAFIGAHFVQYPVLERSTKFKTMQLTSNLRVTTYWLCTALADSLTLVIHLIALNILLVFAIPSSIVILKDLHLLMSSALIGYALAMMAFSYMLSMILSDHKGAITFVFMLPFIIFLLFNVARLVEFLITAKKGIVTWNWLSKAVGWIGILFLPGDAFDYIKDSLQDEGFIGTAGTPFNIPAQDVGNMWFGFGALIFQIVFYTSLLVLTECQNVDLSYYTNYRNWWRFIFHTTKPTDSRMIEVDRDVAEETTKAKTEVDHVAMTHASSLTRDSPNYGTSSANGRASPQPTSNLSLLAYDLNKSYLKGVPVVQGLSFTVQRGECFGLLGVNGAGKTTTFSMLVAETKPDRGRIWANGIFVGDNLDKYREALGYDPQMSPDIHLNPSQAITLMARLRGLHESSIRMLINSVLELLEMREHQYKSSAKLSGGTKRKLALGMSLIGTPRLLVLDEPTAGVDPLARRGVWQLLKSLRTQNNASIVISSHAMEECEAICDRISIMARGRLRCIGTFLHLRTKFARGCTLRIQVSSLNRHTNQSQHHSTSQALLPTGAAIGEEGEQIDQIVREVQQQLEAAIGPSVFRLADKNVNSATFNITDNRVRRSILFRIMCEFRQKYSSLSLSYMINDSSLEDIFIALAQENQEQQEQMDPGQ